MKRAVLWVCVLVMLLSTATTTIRATELKDKEQEIEGVREDIGRVRGKLDRVKSDQLSVAQQLENIDMDLKVKEDELVHIENQLESTKTKLKDTKAELEKAMEEAQSHEALMGDRLRAMYMMEGSSYMELLLESKNINDFLDRWEMIQFMVTADNEVLDRMVAHNEKIEIKKDKLDTEEQTIKKVQEELSQQKKDIESKKNERQRILNQLQREEEQYERNLEQLEQASKEIEIKIQQILQAEKEKEEQERKKREEAQRQKEETQKQEEANQEGNKPQGDKQDNKNQDIPQTQPSKDQDRGSTLAWPMPGYSTITSGYGPRTHPITGEKQKPHTGIDISGPGINGKNIVAAGDGVVMTSGTNGGYGQCITINHGGNITTLYAHGSQRLVSAGQRVSKGQAIMKVGSTGASTGPHLHFEVRKNGSPVNPMPYLGR